MSGRARHHQPMPRASLPPRQYLTHRRVPPRIARATAVKKFDKWFLELIDCIGIARPKFLVGLTQEIEMERTTGLIFNPSRIATSG